MSSKELKNRLPSPFVSSEIRYNVIIDFCNISVSLGEKLWRLDYILYFTGKYKFGLWTRNKLGDLFYWGERMNWYILVLIIDVPAVHLSIFYLGSDIQGWKMNTEGVAQMRRI